MSSFEQDLQWSWKSKKGMTASPKRRFWKAEQNNETVLDYFTEVISVVHGMRRNEENIDDFHMMKKILRSLDLEFDHVVVTIQESKELDDFIVEELMWSLQAHE